MQRLTILILSVFVLFTQNSFGNAPFSEGLKLMHKKDYKSAIECFKKVIKGEPTNASSYYNQGYCLFELQRYGEAIFCFEKTLQFEPKNANALKNLEVSYFKLEQPGYEPIHSGAMRSIFAFGGNNWAIVGIVSSVLFSLMIILFKNRKQINSRRLILVVGVLFLTLSIASTWFAYATNDAIHNSNFAIVIDKSIPTYDATGNKTEFPIAEGTRIEIIGSAEKGKISAQLSNEQEVIIEGTGWLKL